MMRIHTIAFLLAISQTLMASNYLFNNGKSDYSIILTNDASESEKTAANELQQYLRQIGHVTLPIVTQAKGHRSKCVYIGWTKQTGLPKPSDVDEAYTYMTIGEDLHIFGGKARGTMYGVFSFLEHELGVHWYTSSCTKVPEMKQYQLNDMEHSEKPAIRQRLDFYYDALKHQDWCAHNLLNTQHKKSESPYGAMSAYWGIHTFHTLIPPSVYFKSHPEYFSLNKGKRSANAQLCLTNTDMLRELVKNLKNVIRKNPGYWCYDVSQNDNRQPCECTKCQRLVKKYGGQSGLIIWFVNQVAKDIENDFPDIFIGTLAYRYTRQAPQGIKPRKNVVVRLCDIECCMAHALTECPQNKSFLDDMNKWKNIAPHIYIWDYTTGFLNYLLPFSNFHVLAKNYQLFQKSNVIGVLEEGAHDAPWSEFSELKQWLIAKLLWNPCLNVDSLATLFICDYYGKAAPYVNQYYQLCNRQVTADTHFTIKIGWENNLYSNTFISDGLEILLKGINASEDENMKKRCRRLAAQLYYLQLRRNNLKSVIDDTKRYFIEILQHDSTIIKEHGYTLEDMLKDLEYH